DRPLRGRRDGAGRRGGIAGDGGASGRRPCDHRPGRERTSRPPGRPDRARGSSLNQRRSVDSRSVDTRRHPPFLLVEFAVGVAAVTRVGASGIAAMVRAILVASGNLAYARFVSALHGYPSVRLRRTRRKRPETPDQIEGIEGQTVDETRTVFVVGIL